MTSNMSLDMVYKLAGVGHYLDAPSKPSATPDPLFCIKCLGSISNSQGIQGHHCCTIGQK